MEDICKYVSHPSPESDQVVPQTKAEEFDPWMPSPPTPTNVEEPSEDEKPFEDAEPLEDAQCNTCFQVISFSVLVF